MPELGITNENLRPQLVPGLLVGVGPNQPFIGEEVFNPVPVVGQDFDFQTFSNFGFVDDGDTKRGMHSHSKILTPPTTDTKRGYAEEHSSKIPLDVNMIARAEAADADPGLRNTGLSRADRLRQSWMAKLVFNERIQREQDVAAIVTNPDKYATGLKVTNISYRTCTVEDLKNQRFEVQARSGYLPDTWVMDRYARTALDTNDHFLDRINGGATSSDPAVVTDELLARLVGVKRVLVGQGIIQPETAPGLLAPTSTRLWRSSVGAGFGAFLVTGDADTTDEFTMAFGKVFYPNVPGTGLRFGAWSWLDAEPNTIEWQKIAEYRLTAQVSQAGFLSENVTQ